ncbi:hypothetical protein FKW77_008677 [Venturia effusa]|uniref:SH3 domain-containing protein n=1 Tax=Venturia effusa TaxID=50376 RepID=A0A517KZY8_9PEZI|nr:hypothetical protein FKW77_008677 [Venturia effusa]
MADQALPMKFPCWVKAVYSWGGETRRDLGFIEGDLIECLNAGDGSWWMGRLRRDKRMVGLFPSNFVQVLPDTFTPPPQASRNASPLPRQNSANTEKKSFRKPFGSYSKADVVRKRESDSPVTTPNGSLKKKTRGPFSSMKRTSDEKQQPSPLGTPQQSNGSFIKSISPAPRGNPSAHPRAISPAPAPYNYRAPSPAPPSQYRAPSPAPPSQYRAVSPAPQYQYSRAPSPAPPSPYRAYSPAPPSHNDRAPSPAPHTYYGRAPSPAPPSHYRAVSPAPSMHYHQRAPSPARTHAMQLYREPSPNPQWDQGSPPPPAPPPHRHAQQSRAPSSQPYQAPEYGHAYRNRTPEPATPNIDNATPSPIAMAMNDVMKQFEDMSTIIREPSPPPKQEPPSVWSPEAFDELYTTNMRPRAHTSAGMGIHQDSGFDEGPDDDLDGPAHIDDYVPRMEARLRKLHAQEGTQPGDHSTSADNLPPDPPPKSPGYRSQSSMSMRSKKGSRRGLRHMRSGYEIGKEALNRTFTLKSSSTNATDSTSHTLASIESAGGMSAASAGSFYRKKWGQSGQQRPHSVMDARMGHGGASFGMSRPQTPSTGISYHSSHDSVPETPGTARPPEWAKDTGSTAGILGGLSTPLKPRKSGFFKKMLETAKTNAANARSTISSSGTSSRPGSPVKLSKLPNGVTSIAGGTAAHLQARPQSSAAARDMGLGGANDWVQVRRDINRSNSLSNNERIERSERCVMHDIPVLAPIELLHDHAEGDEGLDGLFITDPTDFTRCNLSLVDKSARSVQDLPPGTLPSGLVQGYLCRPYRSDVQRLRAIFTWVSERVAWEEDFEIPPGARIDTRRVIQSRQGCSQEIAYLVSEMCAAVGIHCEIVRGYLKTPGEMLNFDAASRPNHWWNAVIVDGEWRILDASLAGPTHARRGLYSTTAGRDSAESWYFLARPMEICYTHIPMLPEQQHIVPPVDFGVLVALPAACPAYFRNLLQLQDFDTSVLHLENLEMAHIYVEVPDDVECVAEVEVRTFARDADGDFFESGELVKKPVLAQAEWLSDARKRFTIKALLPGDEGQGVLKVYAGKRGLMHSVNKNPHALSLAFPLMHTGQNPPYNFFTRHPTPHAQRQDLYVVQPQCARLAANNTFVFSVRQHPSSLSFSSPSIGSTGTSGITFSSSAISGRNSPNPYARPTSAMSVASISASGSNYSNPSNSSGGSGSSGGSDPSKFKPAKLAIQSPSGKIIRLTRKSEHAVSSSHKEAREGTEWETVIKVGERGVWRGLVLADRSARCFLHRADMDVGGEIDVDQIRGELLRAAPAEELNGMVRGEERTGLNGSGGPSGEQRGGDSGSGGTVIVGEEREEGTDAARAEASYGAEAEKSNVDVFTTYPISFISSRRQTAQLDTESATPAITPDRKFPEGGKEAWLVVLGSTLALYGSFGFMVSIGTLQEYWAENQLRHYSARDIGWIPSLFVYLALSLGIWIGPLFDRYGPKYIALFGSIGYVVMAFLLAHCTLYWHFILCCGILGGVTGATLTTTSLGVVAHWFEVRRGLAQGIAMAGSSFGGLTIPLILRKTLPTYGFPWSMRILGFLFMGTLIPANILMRARLPPAPDAKKKSIISPSIFGDMRFTLLALSVFGFEIVLFGSLGILPTYATLATHYPKDTGFYLISTINGVSCLGRLIPGYISDKIGRFNTLLLFIFTTLLFMLTLWLPLGTHSLPTLYIFAALFGFGTGCWMALTPACIGQLCRAEEFGRYYGTLYFIASLATLVCVPVSGELISVVGAGPLVGFFCAVLGLAMTSYRKPFSCL